MSLFDPKEGIFGQHALSRRAALSTLGIGLGSIAMQSMLGKTKPLPDNVAPGPHLSLIHITDPTTRSNIE